MAFNCFHLCACIYDPHNDPDDIDDRSPEDDKAGQSADSPGQC